MHISPKLLPLLGALCLVWTSAQAACRDPDVARRFGSVAYAAEADATIQYFGHNFFLITTRSGTRIVTDPLDRGGIRRLTLWATS